MEQQDKLKRLAEELATYVKNGDDGLVKVSQKAINEVIALLKLAASLRRPED